jgi:hypothetical protein
LLSVNNQLLTVTGLGQFLPHFQALLHVKNGTIGTG